MRLFLTLVAFATSIALFAQTRYIDAQFQVEALPLQAYQAQISLEKAFTGQAATPTLDTHVYRTFLPMGDMATDRPVVIIHHTGSYMPIALNGGLTGSINDQAVIDLAGAFASRGYVVVTPTYRLGWNVQSQDEDEQTATLLIASLRGAQDMHSMTRYLRKTVAEDGNPLGINPSRIIAIGLGTGGYNVLNSNFLQEPSEVNTLNKFIDSRDNLPYYEPDLHSDPFGLTQTPLCIPQNVGYESGFALGVNLGGAMGDETWIDGSAAESPVIGVHWTTDQNAPYGIGNILVPTTGNTVLEDSPGSRVVVEAASTAGVQTALEAVHAALVAQNDPITLRIEANKDVAFTTRSNFETTLMFPNMYGFVKPTGSTAANEYNWADTSGIFGATVRGIIAAAGLPFTFEQLVQQEQQSNPTFLDAAGSRVYTDTIMRLILPRAYGLLNLQVSSSEEVSPTQIGLNMFPNPATGSATIEVRSDVVIEEIRINNLQGQLVRTIQPRNSRHQLDLSGLAAGMHYITVETNEGSTVSKLTVQ